MANQESEDRETVITFGRRKVRPRVCIADDKSHIRTFLADAFEELGFVHCECPDIAALSTVLDAHLPDLIVLGPSAIGPEAAKILRTLEARAFNGKLLLLGPHGSPAVAAIEDLAKELEIAVLPQLETPFGEGALRDSVASLLPTEEMVDPPINVGEALSSGWLELWYQPQFDMRSLAIRRAEGLIRIRHPTWGVIPAAFFIPDDGDPHFCALSEFVIGRAIEDWRYFITQRGGVEIAINLPIAFLQAAESVPSLCRQLPEHPAWSGLTAKSTAPRLFVTWSSQRASQSGCGFTTSQSRLTISERNGPCSTGSTIFPSARSRSIESLLTAVPPTV